MPKTPFARHLAAVWFADIAGYSTRAAEDERGALQLVEILQTLARDAVQRHEGRIVKFMGDAILAEFPSTEMAVRAAGVLNEEFAEQSAGTGHAHDLRIGIHVGDVAVGADGDLYGDGVNAAARIQQAAEPGQVVLSEDVWRQLRGRAEFQFESLGSRSFKGVGSIGLYAVSLKEEAFQPPPSAGESEKPRAGEERKGKIHSVAVLPFADLSAERDQEYFSDGVAEEILDALTKVGGLHVPARTSCFAFRGASIDAREIGKRLGVETLLEGSIRKAGNRLRITVQLIDARNGYHLWSERFDREIEDIFAIQEEIARRVVGALGLSLTGPEERRFLKSSTTTSVEAYEFYLRGRKLFQKWTANGAESARRMFQRAIELDPNFAAAWAGLATTHVHLFRWGREPGLTNAHKASERALQLDPDLAEAHVAAGQAFAQEARYADAASEYEAAIALDPTLFDAHYYYGRSCLEDGDFEKAVRLFEAAHRVRPEDYEAYYFMAQGLMELQRPEEARGAYRLAIELTEKHLELNPDEARAYSLGATGLAFLGEAERSKQWTEQAMLLGPDDISIVYNHACNLAVSGDAEGALETLERAIEGGLMVGDWMQNDSDLVSLRDHPRFRRLVNRLAGKDSTSK